MPEFIGSTKVSKIAEVLKLGKVGVMPSDTQFGMFASVQNPPSVERLYQIRKRQLSKPFIVLIPSVKSLSLFKIRLNIFQKLILSWLWPNPLSLILPVTNQFAYIHRGTNSIAFRLPNNQALLKIMTQAGPLVAPSANMADEPPVTSATQALAIFKNRVDFYVKGKANSQSPSTVVNLSGQKMKVERYGTFKLNFITKLLLRLFMILNYGN